MGRPTEDEIETVLEECMLQQGQGGSRFPGMSYEQGVEAAIRWVRGTDHHPLDD